MEQKISIYLIVFNIKQLLGIALKFSFLESQCGQVEMMIVNMFKLTIEKYGFD